MLNETWHKAVFYRDPFERFVSAFRSKCEGRDRDGPLHCQRTFGGNFTFVKAVEAFVRNGGALTPDAHFTPQARFCGGVLRTLRYYDTVEPVMNHLREKVERLLHKINAEKPKEFDEIFTPKGAHFTDARHNMAKYQLPDTLLKALQEYYKEDYLIH